MLVTLLRTILIYVVVVCGLRLMGKRQLGELQPSELVVTILVSDIATLPIQDPGFSLAGGAVPILTLVCFEVLLSAATLKSRRLRRLGSGTPRIVIRDGVIDQREMKNLRYSVDDLMELLRGGGYFDLQEVGYAIVETTGKLNVCPKAACHPVTPQDMKLPLSGGDMGEFPILIISDGRMVKKGLEFCGITEEWAAEQARAHGFLPEQLFLMTCTQDKQIYAVPKDGFKESAVKEENA